MNLKNTLKIGFFALMLAISGIGLAVVPQPALAQQTISQLITLAGLPGKTMLSIRFKLSEGRAAQSWRVINSILTKLYIKKVFTQEELNTVRSVGNLLIASINSNTRNSLQHVDAQRTKIIAILRKPSIKAGLLFLEPTDLAKLEMEVSTLLNARL